jgi:hypothetical protein
VAGNFSSLTTTLRFHLVNIHPIGAAMGLVPSMIESSTADGLLGREHKRSEVFTSQFLNSSFANLLSATERDRALECCPYGFREHRAQAAFFHLVDCFGGSATR